jgi:hypothetical protein
MDDSPAAEGLQPEHVPPCPYPYHHQVPERPCPCPAHAAGQPCPCHAPVPGRPLPDLMAIRLAEVPNGWPPYDDEVSGGDAQAAPQPGSCGDDGNRTPARGHRAGEGGRRDGTGDADADRWPSQFAQVLAETLAGDRPASQITPWTTERARAHIRRLGPLLAAEQRPRVHRVLTSRPVEDVVEVAVIVGFGSRTHALAARLERAGPQPATLSRPARQARWLCTAVESA